MNELRKIQTTVIGSYPKPDYINLKDWFRNKMSSEPSSTIEKDSNKAIKQAVKEVVEELDQIGIDIVNDGEIPRENYIYYHCRHIDGINFDKIVEKTMRDGAYVGKTPTLDKEISPKPDHFLVKDWELAQSFTKKPVKITIPGPLTITDNITDSFYLNEKKLGEKLAEVLNSEIKALAKAGCQHIQIDEPVLARYPQKALGFAIENIERCFHNISKDVTKITHICCGYPNKLDDKEYEKADPDTYFKLADTLESADIDAISIEDAHRKNDLKLLEHFKTTSIILGVIAIARTEVESIEAIRSRLKAALDHIDKNRLIAAPDCGLGMLPRDIIRQKLTNMVKAAKTL